MHGREQLPRRRPNGTSKIGKYWYLFKLPPALTGKDLVESGITADVDPNTGSPIVTLQFTGHGSKEFKGITEDEFNRGRVNAGQAGQLNATDQNTIATYAGHNAIVLDGQLGRDAVHRLHRPAALAGHRRQRADHGAERHAAAARPRSSSRAARCRTRSSSSQQTKVSATLGKSSLHQAILAAAAGLLIVAIFLLVLYRFLGLVAVFGLAIYALLYYAAILLFNVTLTLPGFAGLILTIGVAADANVVVFERIKEEVRAGRSVRAAIAAGYGKGFHTILDANVVTMITALVIFLIAVADVKGFALMLLIGTVISLLTAVVATRAMLGLLSGFKWFDSPRFMGAQGQQTAKWLQIDFMGKRRLWFAISGADHPRRPRLARRPGPQSRDRLQGRVAAPRSRRTSRTRQGQVQAFMAQPGPARRGRPGPGPRRQRRLHDLAGPHEDARAGKSRATWSRPFTATSGLRGAGWRASRGRSATR